MGLSTGIRACDLINLKLSDIDWINETISFKQSKTGNTVSLPLTTLVGNTIANYLSEERLKANNDFLFVRQLAPFVSLSDHASVMLLWNSFQPCKDYIHFLSEMQ